MKPYTINPREEEQCLHLHFRGQVSVQDAREAIDHASQVLAAREWRRLLVNITESPTKMSTLGLYELTLQSIHGLQPGTQIALVAGADHASDAGFVEDVARNRGLCLTAFVDAAQARAWLKRASK